MATRSRLILHDLVISEHLLDSRTGRQPIQLPRRSGEKLSAVGQLWRAGSPIRTSRRASGEQARPDREDGKTRHPVVQVAPRSFCACAQHAPRFARLFTVMP